MSSQWFRRTVAAASFGIILCCYTAQATPLGIFDPTDPLGEDQWFPLDISTAHDSILNYDATSDTLTVTGVPLELFDELASPQTHAIASGSLSMQATINDTGALIGLGSIVVQGTIPTLGYNSGTLLTAELTAFGFDGSDPAFPFEFFLNVTGGDAAPLYQRYNGNGAGVLIFETGFTGDFTQNFSSQTARVRVVPDSGSSALLLTLGLLGCIGGAWKFRRKEA